MYKIVRFFLFLFKPEFIHHISFILIKSGAIIPGKMWSWRLLFKLRDTRLKREVFGIKFDNPVGLAAGFDKDAKLFDELASFGFGFVEIGTVTPLPQDGNPKPRLFRLKEDNAIINRMGFNNEGIEATVARLRRKKSNIIIGGNIGKNKVTPNERAVNDYEMCFEKLFPYVDYFAVNVSSPNTPGLRELQEKEPLTSLLKRLQELNSQKDKRKPILLKIAPDLTNKQLDDIILIVSETNIDGVIATNTTIDRSGLKTTKIRLESIGNGGLSGKPVKERSTEMIKYLSEKSNKAFPIIGVGGIHSAEDAIEKLEAGAALLQVYTGFIYEGPALVKRINKAILKR
ncbi:MAG: quinone-dependent dihydroorotate dehydrogenase [Flavobacteriales bacterium]|nr:quinone-dependent dihydroorotate dehydrogenase [Flavobacteriales bacterium]HJN63795.1 quinone-dependent dihydroorotate dehydrogenase [Flavobacteriales bacterium]